MIRVSPRSTRTNTPCPYTTIFRSKRPHPDAPADAVLPLHEAPGRGRTRVRRRPPAAPRGRDEPRDQAERDDLHLQRAGAACASHEADEGGQALAGAGAALQGPRRDGCGTAGDRSEDRGVGKECVRTWRSWWSQVY